MWCDVVLPVGVCILRNERLLSKRERERERERERRQTRKNEYIAVEWDWQSEHVRVTYSRPCNCVQSRHNAPSSRTRQCRGLESSLPRFQNRPGLRNVAYLVGGCVCDLSCHGKGYFYVWSRLIGRHQIRFLAEASFCWLSRANTRCVQNPQLWDVRDK